MSEEERLRGILSTIGHLCEHGDVPVHAFGTLIGEISGELIAEHLHQRWLSDPNFAKIAPQIVLHLRTNVAVCSQVLTLIIRDFNNRHKIRSQSRGMFRNYARTLVEFYPVYRRVDKCLSACLIEPLFRCLQILIDDSPEDKDLKCVCWILLNSGQNLNKLNSKECESTILKCRRWLTSNRIQIEQETKFLLMCAIDLWTYSWEFDLFPDCLQRYYEEEENQRILLRHCAMKPSSSGKRSKLYKNSSTVPLGVMENEETTSSASMMTNNEKMEERTENDIMNGSTMEEDESESIV